MKNKFKAFKNNIIIYSVLLIVIIATVIFFNTYYSVGKFESVSDRLLQNEAVSLEDVINVMIHDINNKDALKKDLGQIIQKDEEILSISIFKPSVGAKEFDIVTSTIDNKDKTNKDDELLLLAWHNKEGIAVLDKVNNERYWKIVKTITKNGKKVGLIELHISVLKSDEFIQSSIKQIYFVTALALCIVLLLIVNHMKMFKYVIKSKKLEEIDEMKDSFISMASHELKSPLTAIIGYADLLKDSVNRKEKENIESNLKYINNINISAVRLRDLVEDILEVSRIEQGRLKIELQNVDVVNIINNVIDQASVNAKEKNLELSFQNEEGPQPLLAYCDKGRTQQIVINLISNAIKYTPKGSVKVIAKTDKQFVYIIVEDTGLGISSVDMKNLFSKFYRVKTDKTAKISGTGLGLWISRELARKMGGDLTVESIEGVGSHFILKLKKQQNKK